MSLDQRSQFGRQHDVKWVVMLKHCLNIVHHVLIIAVITISANVSFLVRKKLFSTLSPRATFCDTCPINDCKVKKCLVIMECTFRFQIKKKINVWMQLINVFTVHILASHSLFNCWKYVLYEYLNKFCYFSKQMDSKTLK